MGVQVHKLHDGGKGSNTLPKQLLVEKIGINESNNLLEGFFLTIIFPLYFRRVKNS